MNLVSYKKEDLVSLLGVKWYVHDMVLPLVTNMLLIALL